MGETLSGKLVRQQGLVDHLDACAVAVRPDGTVVFSADIHCVLTPWASIRARSRLTSPIAARSSIKLRARCKAFVSQAERLPGFSSDSRSSTWARPRMRRTIFATANLTLAAKIRAVVA